MVRKLRSRRPRCYNRRVSWEERAKKLEAKRRRMPKHGMSVFLMDAAERKRAARREAAAATSRKSAALRKKRTANR